MRDAVNLGILTRNPLGPVKPPKRKVPRLNVLDLGGRTRVLTLLDALADTPTTTAARLALYTGMREGEVCGLRWADVDIKTDEDGHALGGTATVGRSIGIREGGTYVKATKAERVRDVPLPEDLAAALMRWRAQCASAAMEVGAIFPGELYVTGTIDGGYQNKTTLSREWRALAQGFGVHGTEGHVPTFHDLRHTFATCAIAEGVDVKTVSSILGHANAAMTLNVYTAADPNAKRRAASTINAAMCRKPAAVRRLGRTGEAGAAE